MMVCPQFHGSGIRSFPDAVRLDVELVEQGRVRKGRGRLPMKGRSAHRLGAAEDSLTFLIT